MSKQYLTVHTLEQAHPSDVFDIATTPSAVLSVGGTSTILVHATNQPSFPLVQSLTGAHKLGCHHLVTSRNGKIAASSGFGGDVKIWKVSESGSGTWEAFGSVEVPQDPEKDKIGTGQIWAIALSEDGQYLASTSYDGRINVWDLLGDRRVIIREYETGSADSGSYGLCVDISRDGKYLASGHQNGAVYIFNNDTGRLQYSLPGTYHLPLSSLRGDCFSRRKKNPPKKNQGESADRNTGLAKPVRSVAFSPAGTRLAAGGDSSMIAIYDTKHGEHVNNLKGHAAWISSLDWSDTGEYLLSGAFDGKAKVWSVEKSACVATLTEPGGPLWSVRWLPKTMRNEMFCTAHGRGNVTFYREATGA
ncbi:WD40 repeat-like protein [Xylaria nigripes]|nr:WD40 repeat-like protein [Xylaria nigripes]